jgi:hypothetical protein
MLHWSKSKLLSGFVVLLDTLPIELGLSYTYLVLWIDQKEGRYPSNPRSKKREGEEPIEGSRKQVIEGVRRRVREVRYRN